MRLKRGAITGRKVSAHRQRAPMRFMLLGGIAFMAAVFLVLIVLPPGMPSYSAARTSYQRSDAVLYDRGHRPLQELRVNSKVRRLDWIPIDRISPALPAAIIAAEDRRFYRHHGVDWTAMASALAGQFVRGNRRGASTIPMQLAAKLRPELEPRAGHRSLFQKIRQAAAAITLTARWSKQEILEGYLNLATFRGELQGIDAAARGLFGKAPHGLDSVDAAILASLLRSPNADAATVAGRAAPLARSLDSSIAAEMVSARVNAVLGQTYVVRPEASLAPHAARRLLGPERSGRSVVSTLDLPLQEHATQVLRHHLASVRDRNVNDGAVLVVDNRTGEVLAYIGNQGRESSARDIDGVQAMRQAGSTLKPFIYAKAFDERLLTPASLLEDSPLDIPQPGGIYRPGNYDNRFHGAVSVRTALGSSLNVPAVRALNLVGVPPVVGLLRAMEFRRVREPEYYGPSLALGSIDVALWDLVAAYRALANNGVWTPLKLMSGPAVPERRTVLSPGAAFLVSEILSDRENRNATFSLESPLSTRFWSAVKTGTSKDMRDNWCVGYSSRYTVGVWVGNFSGEPMWDVSGITGAAPIWIEIMNWLHQSEPSVPPRQPSGIVSATESSDAVESPGREVPRILYPANDTIVAFDPDIPPRQQRLFFEAKPASAALHWVVDGRPFTRADSLRLWTPVRGKHRLDLVDGSNRTFDSVQFEVRGGPSRAE